VETNIESLTTARAREEERGLVDGSYLNLLVETFAMSQGKDLLYMYANLYNKLSDKGGMGD